MSSKCKCTLRESAVGDGCRHCNPEYIIDHLSSCLSEVEVEYDAERVRADKLFDQLYILKEAARRVTDRPQDWSALNHLEKMLNEL